MTKRIPKAEIMLEVRLNEVRTDSQSQKAYEVVYSEANISQEISFYRWFVGLLGLQPDYKYLDISCGRGELVGLAQTISKQSYGLDLSHEALKFGCSTTSSFRFVTANSQVLPYAADSFDVISNVGSLEHYVDMKTAIQEMARVLNPNGRAIILVPNTFSLFTNIWIAFRQGRTSIDPYQPIQRYGARMEWQELLEDNGLKVEKTIKYERAWPYTWVDAKNYLKRPKQLLRLLFTPFIPLNLAFCFVFICRKAL